MKIVIDLDKVDREEFLDLIVSLYVGNKCLYCGHEFDSVQDITEREVVIAGKDKYACRACFEENNPGG